VSRELDRLAEQIRRAFAGEAWHGPSVTEALAGVTPQDAFAHPIAGAHSIWELTLHIASTYRLVLHRLAGEDAQLTPEEDWPAVPAPTGDNWKGAVEALAELNRTVRDAILRFDPARLDQPLTPGAPYAAYTQFIGITQHDLYHAGQIALLKKAPGKIAREDVPPDRR
jgi:uncharacterized damage-inducible protein DinB